MKTINHPVNNNSGFPFVELSYIEKGTLIKYAHHDGFVFSHPLEIENGAGSLFQAIFKEDDKIMCETFFGRSDREKNVWVYSSGLLNEIKPEDEIYI